MTGKPVGGGGARNPNSLANLKPGAGAWRKGESSPALKHGLRSRNVGPLLLDERTKSIADALGDSVPMRGPDGEVLPQFRAVLQPVALMAVQIDRCRAYLAAHGTTNERGRWRPENDALDRKLASYIAALDRLGATPTSLAKLGLNVAQGFDLAQHWAAEDAAERAAAAGDAVDGEASDA